MRLRLSNSRSWLKSHPADRRLGVGLFLFADNMLRLQAEEQGTPTTSSEIVFSYSGLGTQSHMPITVVDLTIIALLWIPLLSERSPIQ